MKENLDLKKYKRHDLLNKIKREKQIINLSHNHIKQIRLELSNRVKISNLKKNMIKTKNQTRLKKILGLRKKEYTLRQIGKEIGITGEAVRKILKYL